MSAAGSNDERPIDPGPAWLGPKASEDEIAMARPRGPGLFLMDTPYFSPESMTAMVAGGAQVVVFTTGAGNSYCSAIAPTMKISANPATIAHLAEQIDFDASGDDREARAQDGVARLLDIGQVEHERAVRIADLARRKPKVDVAVGIFAGNRETTLDTHNPHPRQPNVSCSPPVDRSLNI